MARLNAEGKVARDAPIVADRARGLSWATLAVRAAGEPRPDADRRDPGSRRLSGAADARAVNLAASLAEPSSGRSKRAPVFEVPGPVDDVLVRLDQFGCPPGAEEPSRAS